MAIDLTTMSRKELLKLRDDVEKELTLVEERERKEALKAAQDVAAQYGYSLSELAEAAGKKGAAKANVRKPGRNTAIRMMLNRHGRVSAGNRNGSMMRLQMAST